MASNRSDNSANNGILSSQSSPSNLDRFVDSPSNSALFSGQTVDSLEMVSSVSMNQTSSTEAWQLFHATMPSFSCTGSRGHNDERSNGRGQLPSMADTLYGSTDMALSDVPPVSPPTSTGGSRGSNNISSCHPDAVLGMPSSILMSDMQSGALSTLFTIENGMDGSLFHDHGDIFAASFSSALSASVMDQNRPMDSSSGVPLPSSSPIFPKLERRDTSSMLLKTEFIDFEAEEFLESEPALASASPSHYSCVALGPVSSGSSCVSPLTDDHRAMRMHPVSHCGAMGGSPATLVSPPHSSTNTYSRLDNMMDAGHGAAYSVLTSRNGDVADYEAALPLQSGTGITHDRHNNHQQQQQHCSYSLVNQQQHNYSMYQLQQHGNVATAAPPTLVPIQMQQVSPHVSQQQPAQLLHSQVSPSTPQHQHQLVSPELYQHQQCRSPETASSLSFLAMSSSSQLGALRQVQQTDNQRGKKVKRSFASKILPTKDERQLRVGSCSMSPGDFEASLTNSLLPKSEADMSSTSSNSSNSSFPSDLLEGPLFPNIGTVSNPHSSSQFVPASQESMLYTQSIASNSTNNNTADAPNNNTSPDQSVAIGGARRKTVRAPAKSRHAAAGSGKQRPRTVSDSYMCAFCRSQLPTRASLRKHVNTCHPEEPTINEQYVRTCPVTECKFESCDRETFDEHMEDHIRVQNVTPTGKKRQSLQPLKRHRYKKEVLHCELCSYTCVQEHAFLQHLKYHKNGETIVNYASCDICGEDFPSEVESKKHLDETHRVDNKFKCDLCEFLSDQLKKLVQHRRMHTGTKPHLCSLCPYRSGRRDNLRSHARRVHHRPNVFMDSFCPASYATASRIHIRPKRAMKSAAAGKKSSASLYEVRPAMEERSGEYGQHPQQGGSGGGMGSVLCGDNMSNPANIGVSYMEGGQHYDLLDPSLANITLDTIPLGATGGVDGIYGDLGGAGVYDQQMLISPHGLGIGFGAWGSNIGSGESIDIPSSTSAGLAETAVAYPAIGHAQPSSSQSHLPQP